MKPKCPSMILTGATGMLGNYIKMVFSDYSITTLGRHESDDIKIDFYSDEAIEDLPETDLVVHTAGVQNPEMSIRTNLEGTKHLLAALDKNPPKYFVFISCTEIYGRDNGEEISEKNHPWTTDKFGQSKVLAARAVDEWCRQHGTVCTILRPVPMFGKGMTGKWAELYDEVSRGTYFLVRDNQTMRSVVLAYDVARVVREIHTIGGYFNVADPKHHGFADIVDAMGINRGTDKTPYRIPAKWARLLSKVGNIIPFRHPLPTSESLHFQLSTLTYNADKLLEALPEFKFHDTVEVISRRDKDYPYLD